MSEENMSDSYEVGYGKPPRSTQFQKGNSGNPKGRPKKALDFDLELLRQSKVTIVINVNGRPHRISKHEAVIKQLTIKAISGSIPALRTYVDRYERALEKMALLEAAQAREAERYNDVKNLTDEELLKIIHAEMEKENETKKGQISSAG